MPGFHRPPIAAPCDKVRVDVKQLSPTGESAAQAAAAAINELGPGPYQLQVLLLGGGIYATEGCVLLMLNIVAKGLVERWDLSGAFTGVMASVLLAGLLFGTTLGGLICDRYGRRGPILAAYGGVTTCILAGIACQDIAPLMVAKFALGIFLGLGVPAANTIVAESCPTGHRSNIYCMTMVLFSTGQLYAAGIFWVLSPSLQPQDLHWRSSFAAAALLPALLLGFSTMWLPESVLWLLSQGRLKDAQAGLAELHDCNVSTPVSGRETSVWAEQVLGRGDNTSSSLESYGATPSSSDSVTDSSSDDAGSSPKGIAGSCLRLFRDLWRVRALFDSNFRQTTQTMLFVTGASNFAYYGMIYGLPDTLREATQVYGGSSSVSPAAEVFLAAFCEIPGVFLAVILGLTIGRRSNMSFAFAACSCFLFLAIYAMRTGRLVESTGIIAVAGVKLFLASGYIIVYLYLMECYPTKFRATGLAFCMVCGRFGAACCPLLFEGLNVLKLDNGWFFFAMAIALGTASISCARLPYETKNSELRLEDAPSGFVASCARS